MYAAPSRLQACTDVNCAREHGHPAPHRVRTVRYVDGVVETHVEEWTDDDATWNEDSTTVNIAIARGGVAR